MQGQVTQPASSQPIANAPALSLPAAHVNWLLLGLGFATGMEFYMFDSMNLVLADMTGALGVSSDEASWLLTVYSGFMFLGVPVSIWAARYFGYKRFLISTVVIFACASMGCMVSLHLQTMLVWRAVQGLSGAGLVVWWRASVYMLLSKPQRGPSLMRISTGLFLSSALGLVLSGMLTDDYNWRMIFLPTLVYAVGAVWLLSKYFPDVHSSAEPQGKDTDVFGMILLAVSLISLQVILSRGHIDDWFESPHIRILGGISFIAMAAFIVWEFCGLNPHPLLKLDLLGNRHVMSSALIGIFTGMILSGSLFVLPEFLRNLDASTHSATQAGRVMCIYALTGAAMRPAVVGIVLSYGQRKVITAALLMLITSMLLLAHFLTTGTSDGYYILPLMLYGCCLALLLPSVGSGTVARIEQNKLLDGVSLYMTFRQFGASLGVALLTIILEQRSTLHSSRLFEHVNNASETTRSWLATAAHTIAARSGSSPFEAQRMAIGLLEHTGVHQADTLSYGDAFLFMAAMGFIALCLVPIIPPTPPVTGK